MKNPATKGGAMVLMICLATITNRIGRFPSPCKFHESWIATVAVMVAEHAFRADALR